VDVDTPAVAEIRAPPIGAPQSPQNLLPSGLTLPQLGQSMPHPV
jgi:hypothetical protein